MENQQSLAKTVRRSKIAKSIHRTINGKLFIIFAVGLMAVVTFPYLDNLLTQSDRPTVISFAGTGLTISLVTAYVFLTLLNDKFSTKNILFLALAYNLLIIAVKFALGPASLYRADPTFEAGGLSMGDLNGNIQVLGLLSFGVFVLYWLVFTIMKTIVVRSVSKRFNLKSQKLRAKVNWLAILMLIGFSILTGGFAIGFALLIGISIFGTSFEYLTYVFSTGYSALIVLALLAAIGFAGAMFIQTERETVLKRNLPLLISVIWIGLGLLFIYHVLWAIYFFVLTTIWPFKTVTSK